MAEESWFLTDKAFFSVEIPSDFEQVSKEVASNSSVCVCIQIISRILKKTKSLKQKRKRKIALKESEKWNQNKKRPALDYESMLEDGRFKEKGWQTVK